MSETVKIKHLTKIKVIFWRAPWLHTSCKYLPIYENSSELLLLPHFSRIFSFALKHVCSDHSAENRQQPFCKRLPRRRKWPTRKEASSSLSDRKCDIKIINIHPSFLIMRWSSSACVLLNSSQYFGGCHWKSSCNSQKFQTLVCILKIMTGFLKNLGRICSFFHQGLIYFHLFPFSLYFRKLSRSSHSSKMMRIPDLGSVKDHKNSRTAGKNAIFFIFYWIKLTVHFSADLFEASDESEKDKEKIPTETRREPVTAASTEARVAGDVITCLPDGTKSCETDNLRHLQRSPNVGLDSAHVTSWNGVAARQVSPAGGPEFPSGTRQPLLVQVQQLPTVQPGNNQHTL